jgi:hypothetical protein
MTFDEDELLSRAVGDVGGRVSPGGRRGAEKGARRVRKDVFEVELVVSMPPQAAADKAEQVLSEHGSVLELDGNGGDPDRQVAGIVGSGVANLNPAVVTVTIQAASAGTRLVIRGAAKEGLIKQRAGEKAAKRIGAATGSRHSRVMCVWSCWAECGSGEVLGCR